MQVRLSKNDSTATDAPEFRIHFYSAKTEGSHTLTGNIYRLQAHLDGFGNTTEQIRMTETSRTVVLSHAAGLVEDGKEVEFFLMRGRCEENRNPKALIAITDFEVKAIQS